ncbi:DMT family transporter [Paenibacillus sp.]|jgi:drug/metabolite transporter (DMT)-like permease|uniref:DMT family transporter n=1 Tax=Paenibacillus sp. TaxID=58172 RepID=UPI002827F07C|nr:DMT family transporter [Paenibacillus sp.]MDR0267157.1 DMT family transporter [Paenibacillus sp.]
MKQYKADLIVLMVTVFWGTSYLFMKIGLDTLQPFNLIALRFGVAFVAAGSLFYKRLLHMNRKTIQYAFILGSLLFGLYICMSMGLKSTSTSNAGFLMSMTVIFVPVLTALFLKSKPEKRLMVGIAVAVVGIGMLTLKPHTTLQPGDAWCILAALLFAIHIIITGRAAKKTDSLSSGILQLGFTAFFGLIFSLFFEKPELPGTPSGWLSVIALGVLCSAVGFVLQAIAQKYTTPTHTGLIFALEPVVAAICGICFMKETITLQGYIGAGLVLLGVALSELNVRKLLPGRKLTRKSSYS